MRELGERGDSDFLRMLLLDYDSCLSPVRSCGPDRGFDRRKKIRRTRREPRRCATRPTGMPITSATVNDEGLADVEAANPFRLPRLHPAHGSTAILLSTATPLSSGLD